MRVVFEGWVAATGKKTETGLDPSVAVAHYLRWFGCQLPHFKNYDSYL
jgi:hypothetical protein